MADTHTLLTHTDDEDCTVCRANDIAEVISASVLGCYSLDESLPDGAIEMSVLVQMAGRLFLQGIGEETLVTAIREGINMAKESSVRTGHH